MAPPPPVRKVARPLFFDQPLNCCPSLSAPYCNFVIDVYILFSPFFSFLGDITRKYVCTNVYILYIWHLFWWSETQKRAEELPCCTSFLGGKDAILTWPVGGGVDQISGTTLPGDHTWPHRTIRQQKQQSTQGLIESQKWSEPWTSTPHVTGVEGWDWTSTPHVTRVEGHDWRTEALWRWLFSTAAFHRKRKTN